jgi:ribose transport system substrate-binding protein
MLKKLRNTVGLLGLAATIGLIGAGEAMAAKKYKIFQSMSYIGNDWQAITSNMIAAMARSKEFKDKVDLEVQVAGPNAQKQIQQINAMVQAGADAIVVFPISPTALNPVVKAACAKGVKIFAYESLITEPCAHNVSIDNKEFGRATAQWLVDKLGGKGNVVYINGVPGVSAETDRTEAVNAVFAANPGIKVIATGVGMWSESVARSEMTKILASHKWDEIDGVLSQIGCFSVVELQLEAGIPEDKLKPCSGESGNGNLVQMLPKGTEVIGANGNYRPMGAPGFSTFAPVSTAGYTFKLAVQAVEGKEFPHDILIKPLQLTNDNVKLCQEGSWKELSEGCNVFQPELIGNPAFFGSVYNPETPELGLNAALTGQPEN